MRCNFQVTRRYNQTMYDEPSATMNQPGTIFVAISTAVSNANPIRYLTDPTQTRSPEPCPAQRPEEIRAAFHGKRCLNRSSRLLRYRTSRGSQFCTSVASHLPHLLASHLFFSSFFLHFYFFFVVFFSSGQRKCSLGDAFTL